MATHTQSSRTGISSISLPRTKFILQPHHIQILKMMVTLFVASDPRKLPPLYVLNVNRVLLEAVAEIRAPPTYQEIQRKSAVRIAGKVFDVKEMWTLAKEMDSLEGLIQFFAGINKLLDNTKVARRSMFGYFSRRCHLAFMKLSYEGKYKLFEDYQAWINGQLISGAVYMRNDILSRDHILFKSSEDKKEFARPDEYRIWEMGLATGDDLSAAESLRRFFEQRFHEGNDSGLRQHSLLNLARLHYLRHEHVACRKLLEEAVTVARTCNDGQTLQYCISMLNRLQPLERNRKMAINELQPELHPSEALFDVKKLLVVGNQQPLSAAFERIAQATSLYDLWAHNRRDLVTEEEQWGSHAAQSIAWSMMGNNRLADLEEDIVFAFTDVGGSDNNRLTVTLNRAYRYARQGDYEEAISMLLDTNVWQGLDMTDYEQWATQIWHILMLRASRRGQTKMITDYLWPKRFIHGASLKEYTYGAGAPLHSLIRDPLHEVLTMREAGQGHTAIQPLLTSIWHSEFQQRYASYRPGMILLADIGLEFGMTKWCRKIIDEIMPQLISGDDLEQRAYACYTLARCIIAAADDTEHALRESLFYLKIAESDYSTMEMFRSLQDTQYLLSIVYHNLGMQAERDETAARHQQTQKQADEAKQQVTEDWITDVMDLITEVGSALASRTPRWFKEQRSTP